MEIKQFVLVFAVSVLWATTEGRPYFFPSLYHQDFFNPIMFDPGLYWFHSQWHPHDFSEVMRQHQEFHMKMHQQFLNQQRQWFQQLERDASVAAQIQQQTYALAEVFQQYYNDMITQYNHANQNQQQQQQATQSQNQVGKVVNRLTTVNNPIYTLPKGVTWREFLGEHQPQVSKQAEEFVSQVLGDLQAGHLTQQHVSSPNFFLSHAYWSIVCNPTTVSNTTVTPASSTEQPEQTTITPQGYSSSTGSPNPVSNSNQPATENDSAVHSNWNLAYNPDTQKYEYAQDNQHSIRNVPIV